jgi:hypothetical protein
MPVRDHTLNPAAEPSPLAAALRALPGETPGPDAWPQLAQSLARRGARRRHPHRRHALWLLPPALAAALALTLLLPRPASEPTGSTPMPSVAAGPEVPGGTPATAAASDELASLRQRSQSLERWIAAVSAHAAQDSRDLMAAVEVEDLIGLVDVQLNATRGRADALPLWRQRIALLEDLAMIRGSGVAMAANDDGSAFGEPSMLMN